MKVMSDFTNAVSQEDELESILNGDLDEIIDALITADTAEKLKADAE